MAPIIFPSLAGLCARYGASFQAVDLRWGISEEASLDQRTMDVCLGEVAAAGGSVVIANVSRYGSHALVLTSGGVLEPVWPRNGSAPGA